MPTADAMAAGAPIVTIKFARAHVSYDRVLYAALSQALASQPHARSTWSAWHPRAATLPRSSSRRNSASATHRRLHSMTEMGVPATRMDTSSSTDPAIAASEVRVYVR